MELENIMSQATQDLNNGETRHESRETYAHDDEDVPEREEAQWTKHALSRLNARTSVDRGTPRELSQHASRRRCARQERDPPMSTHESTTTTQDDLTKHTQTTTQGLALCGHIPLDVAVPQWVLARTPTVHWAPEREGRGWPERTT